jgi:tetratricopeptide (TPR) repeat protein
MSLWRKLFGDVPEPKRLDYLNEGLALERQGDLEGALTSYRLAYRDNPQDARVLLNMAIAFTKTQQPEDAIRHYKRALELDPSQSGAHYGVAFLLLSKGETSAAAQHLRQFLQRPPRGPDAARWVEHARSTLERLELPAAAQETA